MSLCILATGVAGMVFAGSMALENQNIWDTLVSKGASGTGAAGTFLYPLSSLCAVCPGNLGLELFLVCHVLLVAIGTFLLVQHWTGSRIESILGATGAALCIAPIMSWLPLNAVAASACVPLIVWLGDRAFVRDCFAMIPVACALSAQMLTGSLPIIVLTWLALATLSLDVTRPGSGLDRVSPHHRLGAALSIAFGLCATQVLPFLI